MQHGIRKYLFDIAQAATDIQEFTRNLVHTQDSADVKTQAAVERKFKIIGEALDRIKRRDRSLLAMIPEHERIIGFRKVISHGYNIIDPELVWDAIQNHLPSLRCVIENLLNP